MKHSPLTVTPTRLHVLPWTRPRYIDCYDRAVAILTRHPELILFAWRSAPHAFPHEANRHTIKLAEYCHCLFNYATSSRTMGGCGSGCLTQIREHELFPYAETPSLTKAIYRDMRLPSDWRDITVDTLPVFAGWQRRLDIALDRKPLPMRIGG